MSVYYYLASYERGEAVRIGQGDRNGMTSIYSGIPLAMKQLRAALNRGSLGCFVLLNDLTDEDALSRLHVIETDGEVTEPAR